MNALIARIERLYSQGHAKAPPTLWNDPRLTGDESFSPAAVLVAITNRAEPGMLLIHRPDTMRAHPGQIAFPGGRCDHGETPIQAALREAQEELGIDPAQVHVIGSSDLYRSGSGYEITPVLAVVPGDITITPNPHEVAAWFEVPAAHVLDPRHHTEVEMEHEGIPHRFLEILWQGHRIWGVTAAILSNLSHRLDWHG